MKSRAFLTVIIIVAFLSSCEKQSITYDYDQNFEKISFLKLSFADFEEIKDEIDGKFNLYDTNSLNYELLSKVRDIIEDKANLNLSEIGFKSILEVYYEILQMDNPMYRNEYLKKYENYLEYDELSDNTILKILPSEAALLNSAGIISINDQIIQLGFDYKKIIVNGNPDLISTLSDINQSTSDVIVENFNNAFQKIKHTRRIEVRYPMSTPRTGKYHVIGSNYIILHIFRGIFVREYTYYVESTFQPFYDYSPITAPSASHRITWVHTGEDPDFVESSSSSLEKTNTNQHIFTTDRERIILRKLRKKTNIADDLRISTRFKITYPDGFIFEDVFTSDTPLSGDDGNPVFD